MQNSTQHTANFDAFVSSPFAVKALQLSNFQKLEKAKESDENKSISRGLKMAAIIAAGYDFLRTSEAKKAAKENNISLKPAALAMQIYEMPSSTFYKYLKGHENAERVSEFLEYAESMRQSGKKLRSVGFDAFTDWCAKKPTAAAATDKPTEQKISVKFGDKAAIFNLTTNEVKNALSLSELETIIRQLFNERKALRKLAAETAAKKETLTTAAEKAAAAAKKAAIVKAGKKKTTQPDSVQALNDMQTA